jgi:predicted nucleotidyltransferase
MKKPDILLQPEYRMVKNMIDNQQILYLTLGGSHAYGLATETSDIDMRGIMIEPTNVLFGLSNFEMFEDKTTDTTIYALKKIFQLLLNCNPNVIELLGTRSEEVLYATDAGCLIKNNVDLFISNKAIGSFGGYAGAQLRRLENALIRETDNELDTEKHILNTLKHQMINLNEKYCNFDLDLKIENDKMLFDAEFYNFPVQEAVNAFSEINNTLKTYKQLTNRNKKKDDKALFKHASHLFRLFIMGTEILSGKGVNTYRTNDKQLLLDIKQGVYSFEEVFSMLPKYEQEFEYAKNHSVLTNKPDYKKVEELLYEVYRLNNFRI